MSAELTPTRGLFITGTDTGVGKTVVASGLVRLLAQSGQRVAGLKPVASGAARIAAGLRNDDALALAAAGSIELPYEQVNPWCFEPAIAPHLAAREAGVVVTPAGLVEWYRRASRGLDLAIVEGAGGWRVPLHPEGFLSDLPEMTGMDVLMVVGLRLGCLNHARLTLEAIMAAGRCRFVGWIGNRIDPTFERLDENLETLTRLLGAPALAVVPPLDVPDAAHCAARLDGPRLRSSVFPPY
jgi:dethiobiotin synthetase